MAEDLQKATNDLKDLIETKPETQGMNNAEETNADVSALSTTGASKVLGLQMYSPVTPSSPPASPFHLPLGVCYIEVGVVEHL